MNKLPLEKQVCTLEQSQKLAELLGGDAPESLWVWWYHDAENFGLALKEKADREFTGTTYPAYTGDELGVLLPKRIFRDDKIFFLESEYKHKNYTFFYRPIPNTPYKPPAMRDGETEAQAKATLAIQGLGEGLIKKEDFNYV